MQRARRSHGAARHDELPPPMQRSKQEQRDAGSTRDAGLTANSVRFRRRVRMQGNRPRACRLGAIGVGAEQKRCTGDATKCGDPAGGYAGVPAVFQRHTRVSRGGLNRERVDPEVRGGVGIANQSGPIGFFHESTTSSNSYSSPIIRARPQITAGITSSAILYPLQFPANFFITHGISSSSSFSLCRSCSPREFTFHSFFSITKATPRFALIR
jgi:hypothetical protein